MGASCNRLDEFYFFSVASAECLPSAESRLPWRIRRRAGLASGRTVRSFLRPRRNPACILRVPHFQLLLPDANWQQKL